MSDRPSLPDAPSLDNPDQQTAALEAHAVECERINQEFFGAKRTIERRYAVSMRLVLWLMRYVWPRLTATEKAEVRAIIPDEMESEIKAALEKLP